MPIAALCGRWRTKNSSVQSIPRPNAGPPSAGKEAVFKALGISAEAVRLTEIEILPDENGGPVVSLYGTVHYQAKRREIQEVLISLSWEDEYALAVAVAQ